MASVLSVNVGKPLGLRAKDVGVTGIDKRPVRGDVEIIAPRWPGVSGLAGDAIGDVDNHGGPEQAVYAYAREDLDAWGAKLGRPLECGAFGENLTTAGIDVSEARIGERWKVGERCILEVSSPRIPCRTFSVWLREERWERRFTRRGVPGAYLRVITPGRVRAGDAIVASRPDHAVTVRLMFRALTLEKHLLPLLAPAGDALPDDVRRLMFTTAEAHCTGP
jgi:MOSC domain-containing protein YiiM